MRYEGELKGKAKKVTGSAKEKLGKAMGNQEMQDKGEREKYEGRIQEKMGKARRKVGEAVEDLGDQIAG
jgi:uncharacterized protein YjbJ (UPF0337 family)